MPGITYSDPREVARKMLLYTEESACVDCGYAYTYALEGCDACRPITELLATIGVTNQEDI